MRRVYGIIKSNAWGEEATLVDFEQAQDEDEDRVVSRGQYHVPYPECIGEGHVVLEM